MNAAELTRWGRAYLGLGWELLLLAPGTKVPPRGSRGVLDCIAGPDELAACVARFGGRCNLGVVTGASGLLVVDVDRGHASGADGEATLRTLAAGRPVPDGPQQATPSGGRHLLFHAVEGIGPSSNLLGLGVDVRAARSYVVVAPSAIPPGAYRWLTSPRTPLPELPTWLTPPRPEPTSIRDGQAVEHAAGDRILAGLARTVVEAPRGCRNDRLFWAACRLAEQATAGRVPLDVGAAVLLDAAAEAGLPEAEADRTLRSAVRRVGAA